MRKIIITLLLVSISYWINAQQSESKLLQDFKYRIDNFRALNFSVGGGALHESDRSSNSVINNSNFSGNTGIGLTGYKSTDRQLRSSNFSVNSGFSKSTSNEDDGKARSFSGQFAASLADKYFKGEKFFLLESNSNGRLNTGKASSANVPLLTKSSASGLYINLGAGIGKGRLEFVTDMQNALWLHKELSKEKVLKRQLSEKELMGLGMAVTKANNTRVLDSRRRNRFILETVDGFLQKNGLISKTDILYFSSLNDVLFYAINEHRMSGVEKALKLSPSFSYSRNYGKYSEPVSENEDRTKVKALTLIASWKKYKPVSLYHQRNYGFSFQAVKSWRNYLMATSNSGVVNESKWNDNSSQVSVSAFLQHKFYPNTRTSFNLSLETEGGYNWFPGISKWFNLTRAGCSLNYFISYNARLTGGVSASIQKNYNDITSAYLFNTNLFSLNASIGLEINL